MVSAFALTAHAKDPTMPTAAEEHASLSGTYDLVGIRDNRLVIDKDGVLVELKTAHKTLINGKKTLWMHAVEPRLVEELQPFAQVKVSAALVGTENHALSLERVMPTAAAAQPGVETRARAAERFTSEPKLITAKILRVDDTGLVLDFDGCAVKVTADAGTRLNRSTAKAPEPVARLLERDFKPGQRVTVGVERRDQENRAASISR
jgi:hypothetical protein